MTPLDNMAIGTRLALGFATILAFSIVASILGVWRLHTVAHEVHMLMQQPLAKERIVSDWHGSLQTNVRRAMAVAKGADPSLAALFVAEAAESAKSSTILQKNLEALLVTEQEKALFRQIGEHRKAYLASRDRIFKEKEAGNVTVANQLFDSIFMPSAALMQKRLKELLDMQRKTLSDGALHIDRTVVESRNFLIALALLALALGVVCAYALTTSITRPLRTAVDIARRIATGDLGGRIAAKSGDEVGQLLRALAEVNNGLSSIVGAVRSGTETIVTAAGQIAGGSLDLSARTEQQASTLEETASAMEELTSTVRQNADNARQARQLAISASQLADQGGEVVSRVVGTMLAINASASKVVDIIGVIDGIAFQTNILALNAAVEAARAGEQGRGFAVVAAEVRNLAHRSSGAAREIKALIGDSVEKIETGATLAEQAGITMRAIVDSFNHVTGIIEEIACASNEQTSGIEQINQAIISMDGATQQNAALADQATTGAQSMERQAGDLSRLVGVFKLTREANRLVVASS